MRPLHYRIVKKAVLLTALCLFTLSPLSAQNNNGTDQGTVTVNQSQEINDLVFGKGKKQTQPTTDTGKKKEEKATPTPKPSTSTAPITKPSTPQASTRTENTTTSPSATTVPTTSSSSTTTATPRPSAPTSRYETDNTTTQTVNTGRKVMRRGYKMQGYRVQVFAGGNKREDRVKAQEMGKRVKAAFPNQPVYTHFHSPRWTCRIGNFRKFETAERIVKQARNLGFHQACIVSEKITVQDR